MNDVVGTVILGLVIFSFLYLIGRWITGGIGRESRVRQSIRTKCVENESQVDDMLSDITGTPYGGTTQTRYIVNIDTRKWDWESVAQAHWLKNHPHPRVSIERVVLEDER